MGRSLAALVAVVVTLAMASSCCGQSIERVGEKAKIDWTNLYYIVEGQGAMPSEKEQRNRGRAFLQAKDYAKMDAIANLLMAIEGTTISYESTGKDYMANTTIRQKIEGFVKNVEIVKAWTEKIEGDTIVYVQARAPMFGATGPGTIFLKEEAKTTPAEPTSLEADIKVVVKPDKPGTVITTTVITPPDQSKPFTGLIIDASGYRIHRSMSPKIRRADGSEVWGTVSASWDLIQDKGIVAYATSLEAAKKNPRVGSNPLIIRASGRAGRRFYSDVVITDADAELLLAENAKSHFLDTFNVLFVKDPVL